MTERPRPTVSQRRSAAEPILLSLVCRSHFHNDPNNEFCGNDCVQECALRV